MIIILTGKSAAGKDTLRNELLFSFTPFPSYTTRPMRDGEQEGVEYHFCDYDEFINTKMIESRSYNTLVNGNPDTWYYGTPEREIDAEQNYVMIKDPAGALDIQDYYGRHNAIMVEIDTPQDIRTYRAMQRGSFDSTEWTRRLSADDKDFMNFMADYTISGTLPISCQRDILLHILQDEQLRKESFCYDK